MIKNQNVFQKNDSACFFKQTFKQAVSQWYYTYIVRAGGNNMKTVFFTTFADFINYICLLLTIFN